MSESVASERSGKTGITHPYLMLLVCLTLLLIAYPYLGDWIGEILLTGLLTAIVLGCLYSVSGNKRTLWVGLGLSVPAFLQRTGEFLSSQTVGATVDLPYRELYSLPLFLFIVAHILRDILSQKQVTGETLRGAICLYLLLGIIWTSFYMTIHQLDPDSFKGVELEERGHRETWKTFLFFSFITLTTLGYGDIVPVHDSAQSLAILEAVCGVLYIAILISKLVSMYGRVSDD